VAAELGHIEIDRIDANQQRETVSLDLPAASSPASAREAIASFPSLMAIASMCRPFCRIASASCTWRDMWFDLVAYRIATECAWGCVAQFIKTCCLSPRIREQLFASCPRICIRRPLSSMFPTC